MSKLHMKKLAVTVAALGAVAMGSGVAQAANTSGTFNVSITLTSTCTLGTVGAVNFAYTSAQGGAQAGTGGAFNVTCTTSFPYTFGLQTGNGAAVPPGASTISVTDNAVNLGYTLGLSAAGGAGSGAAQSYSVTGSMAASQSGTCASATCTNGSSTNAIQTLILNY